MSEVLRLLSAECWAFYGTRCQWTHYVVALMRLIAHLLLFALILIWHQQQPFKWNNGFLLFLSCIQCFPLRLSTSFSGVWVIPKITTCVYHYQSWLDLVSDHNRDLLFCWRSLLLKPLCLCWPSHNSCTQAAFLNKTLPSFGWLHIIRLLISVAVPWLKTMCTVQTMHLPDVSLPFLPAYTWFNLSDYNYMRKLQPLPPV